MARDPGSPYHADGGADGRSAGGVCLQDTTELDFTTQPGIAGLGRLSYEAQHGLYVHPTLAVTPAGVALGVLDAWLWARKPKDQPDVKESLRWVEGYEIVADLAETVPDTRLVWRGGSKATCGR